MTRLSSACIRGICGGFPLSRGLPSGSIRVHPRSSAATIGLHSFVCASAACVHLRRMAQRIIRGQIGRVLGHAPPYALPRPGFRFRALAAHAGRAPLGGEREVALACFMAARLAAAVLPPHALPVAVRVPRGVAAKGWFASLALPAATRIPFARLIDASTEEHAAALAPALEQVIESAATYLDGPSRAELDQLLAALRA